MQEKSYREQGRVFLTRAFEYLNNGDLYQASEKGWGAAAQMVKAVAQSRDWEHNFHGHLVRAVGRLSRETANREFSSLFSFARSLHQNFYEGDLDQEEVADYLSHVSAFVEKMDALLVPDGRGRQNPQTPDRGRP